MDLENGMVVFPTANAEADETEQPPEYPERWMPRAGEAEALGVLPE